MYLITFFFAVGFSVTSTTKTALPLACVVEAPDQQTLASWFQKMMMPYDAIVPIEFEGDRGNIRQEVVPQAVHAHA